MDATPLASDQLWEHSYRKQGITDHILDDARLAARCPLDNGRHRGQPEHPAGRLDTLPGELVAEVLLALDLPSLTVFRRVNRRAMSLVDSLHQYLAVLTHCPDILRAILSIGARSFDCATLFGTLSTTKCATCDLFGGHLYLVTCRRVCYFCFTQDVRYFPVTATLATRRTGRRRRDLARLPHVISLPGRFTGRDKVVRRRIMLLDRQSLRDEVSDISTQTFNERLQPLDITTREPLRYVSIISAPYFTSSGRLADWGYYCTKCRDKTKPDLPYRIKYTEDGFLDHIAQHGINHGSKKEREHE